MELLQCVLYLAVLGVIGFLAGRLLPYHWLQEDAFPLRAFSWEREGRIYEKLGIRKWQNRMPDMSRILPCALPAKRLAGRLEEKLPVMIKETCVAEVIHVLLNVAALRCLWIWRGRGGRVVTFLYALGNLPYILIQRYNRPRLRRLYAQIQKRKTPACTGEQGRGEFCADTNIKLQYGGGA